MSLVCTWSTRQTWNPTVPGMWQRWQKTLPTPFHTTNRNGWKWCWIVQIPCISATKTIRQFWSGPVEMSPSAEKIFLKCHSYSAERIRPVWFITKVCSMTAATMTPAIWKARCIHLLSPSKSSLQKMTANRSSAVSTHMLWEIPAVQCINILIWPIQSQNIRADLSGITSTSLFTKKTVTAKSSRHTAAILASVRQTTTSAETVLHTAVTARLLRRCRK